MSLAGADALMSIFGLRPCRWVIREGTTPKQGRYYRLSARGAGPGWGRKQAATFWSHTKPTTLAEAVGGRVVRLVPRP